MKGQWKASWFACILICILVACKSNSNVIEVDTMKKVMWDMARVDKYVDNYLRRDTTLNLEVEASKRYAAVFALHKINEAQFKSSLEYYRSEPLRFRKLMDSVNVYANRIREQNFSEKVEETAGEQEQASPISTLKKR